MVGDSYWQQQYENARPPGVILWSGNHRQLIRGICALLLAGCVGMIIWAVVDGGTLTGSIANLVGFSIQTILWGVIFARQAMSGLRNTPQALRLAVLRVRKRPSSRTAIGSRRSREPAANLLC